jgi:hypothetical protein
LTYVLYIYGGLIVALAGSWIIVQFAFRHIRISWIALGNVPRSLSSLPKDGPVIRGRNRAFEGNDISKS